MAYTGFAELRNYKKRCELYTRSLELEAQRDAALEEANQTIADDDDFFKECDVITQKYDPMIFFLRRLERYLEYPETKNEWFCGIVKEKGEGKYSISERQALYFSKYFEESHGTSSDGRNRDPHKQYCRAAGYFCTLFQHGKMRSLTIEKIEEPLDNTAII